jgi:hypothetical protein
VQREEFKRLGVTGNWSNPYLTMDYRAERIIAEEFMKFLMNGTLYQGSKPVMWSPVEETALAEAEVEYHDKDSFTIWVKFKVVGTGDIVQAQDATRRSKAQASSSGPPRPGPSRRTRRWSMARISPTGFTRSPTRPRNAGPSPVNASSSPTSWPVTCWPARGSTTTNGIAP